MNVVLNFPANATMNAINKLIMLTELQPSITLATNLSLIIIFIDGSSGCGKTLESYPIPFSKALVCRATKFVV